MLDIIRPGLPTDCRIICVSDIHGCVREFKRLLEKCGYNAGADYLFILGDIVEKGRENLAALRFVKELCQNERVVCIKGNNDTMCVRMAFHDSKEKFFERIEKRPVNTYLEMAKEAGIDSFEGNFQRKREKVNKRFSEELNFMNNLPLAIETKDFIFIHAGIENRPDWENTSELFALTQPWFLRCEHCSPKTVICGHYPTYSFKEADSTCFPVMDKKKRIIDIDGGASTKWAAQLNAFIISYKGGKYETETVYFPLGEEMTVKRAVKSDCKPVYVDWDNYSLTVIEEQKDFWLVKIDQTGETGLIPQLYTGMWNGNLRGWINLNSFLSADVGEKFYCCHKTEEYCFGIGNNGTVGFLPRSAF